MRVWRWTTNNLGPSVDCSLIDASRLCIVTREVHKQKPCVAQTQGNVQIILREESAWRKIEVMSKIRKSCFAQDQVKTK